MKLPFLLYRGEHFNSNFFHNSLVDIDHSFLFVDGAHQTLFVPQMNLKSASVQFKGTVVPYRDVFRELKKHLKGKEVGIDGMNVGFAITERLKKFCRPLDVSHDLLKSRLVKSEEEVAKLKRAAKETRGIFSSLDISKGVSESQIKKQLLIETLDRGLEPAFPPIVAADSNSAFPHYETGNAKINEMVLIDYGVRYKKYCADMTRCFFLKRGKKKSAYNKMKDISASIIGRIPRLRSGSELAMYAERLFEKSGMPRLPHAIGHGIGLEVHEFPRLGLKSKDNLKGAVFAIEPSAYFDDFGVRYENVVHFDGRKVHVL